MTPFSHRPVKRLIPAPDFVANAKKSVSIKTGAHVRRLEYRHQGTHTVTAIPDTAALTKRGDELAVLKMVEVVLNGTNTIIRRTGDEWWWLNYFLTKRFPEVTPAVGDGVANSAFDVTLPLLFTDPGSFRPNDTALETHKLKSAELFFDWGTFTDINADAGSTAISVTPELAVLEATGGDKDPNPRAGLLSDWPFQLREQKTAAGASSTFRFDLTTGNYIYEYILVNTRTSAGVDDDARVGTMHVYSGPKTYFKQHFKAQQEIVNSLWNLQSNYDLSAAAFNKVRRSDASHPKGWCMIDLLHRGGEGDLGYISEGVDARGLNELTLELDVLGAAEIVILPIGRIPMIGVGRDPTYTG